MYQFVTAPETKLIKCTVSRDQVLQCGKHRIDTTDQYCKYALDN